MKASVFSDGFMMQMTINGTYTKANDKDLGKRHSS